VAVTTAKIDKGLYAYSIDVDLYQSVLLARTPSLSASAATWGVGSRVGALDTARLHKSDPSCSASWTNLLPPTTNRIRRSNSPSGVACPGGARPHTPARE